MLSLNSPACKSGLLPFGNRRQEWVTAHSPPRQEKKTLFLPNSQFVATDSYITMTWESFTLIFRILLNKCLGHCVLYHNSLPCQLCSELCPAIHGQERAPEAVTPGLGGKNAGLFCFNVKLVIMYRNIFWGLWWRIEIITKMEIIQKYGS